MVEPAVLLFLGDDQAAKNIQIRAFKQRFLADIKDLADFNIDEADGQDLALKELQEILKRLPLNSKKRLLIIRNIDSLNEPASQYLLDFLANISKAPFRILLSTKEDKKDSLNRFINNLSQSKSVSVIHCRKARRLRAFDLARAIIDEGNPSGSIQILNQLLLDGKEPQQILGGLFWYWNNISGLKSRGRLKKDLGLFIDTDTKIKTGKVPAELALELLVVKLCR